MFVAREHELQVLEKLFTSDSFEMVVLYGRENGVDRRICQR